MEPVAALATRLRASGSASMPSSLQTRLSSATMFAWVWRWKSNRWHRERMVGSSLWGSVVARTKMTWGGGSSSVLRRALEASLVSMWTSSMM